MGSDGTLQLFAPRITAHKGTVTVLSSHGYAGILEEGNTFSKPISVGGDPTEMAEYWVRIDANQPDESSTDQTMRNSEERAGDE